MWRLPSLAFLLWLSQIVLIPVAQAQDAATGEAPTEKHGVRCHATGTAGQCPMSDEPPFWELVERYDPEGLAEALGEGIVVRRPNMPEFVFEPDEIGALIVYLQTLASWQAR